MSSFLSNTHALPLTAETVPMEPSSPDCWPEAPAAASASSNGREDSPNQSVDLGIGLSYTASNSPLHLQSYVRADSLSPSLDLGLGLSYTPLPSPLSPLSPPLQYSSLCKDPSTPSGPSRGSSIRLLNFSPSSTMSPPAAMRKLYSPPAAETPPNQPMMRRSRTSTGRRLSFQSPSHIKGRGVKRKEMSSESPCSGPVRCSFSIGTPAAMRRRRRTLLHDPVEVDLDRASKPSLIQRLDFSAPSADMSPDVAAVRIHIKHTHGLRTDLSKMEDARTTLRRTDPIAIGRDLHPLEYLNCHRSQPFKRFAKPVFLSRSPARGSRSCNNETSASLRSLNFSTFEMKKDSEAKPDTCADVTGVSTGKKLKRCRCKKSKCIKLYCECFARGEMCGSACNCTGCSNNHLHSKQREAAVQASLVRDPSAFQRRLSPVRNGELLLQQRGCNCRKSGCSKRYCECFQAGVECTDRCGCENCENGRHTARPCLTVKEVLPPSVDIADVDTISLYESTMVGV